MGSRTYVILGLFVFFSTNFGCVADPSLVFAIIQGICFYKQGLSKTFEPDMFLVGSMAGGGLSVFLFFVLAVLDVAYWLGCLHACSFCYLQWV